ncbi:hypothetical protein PpBr36_02173, partial [Pyricularia pennisetigena]|uniref:hypothetical protein n=1 Tax=Pyricularia pennisetigena TaxID=1578925 RepID=UPI001154E3A4
VNNELESKSVAVVMDAECIRNRDGFRLLVDLEAIGKRLAQRSGGNGSVLVLAVFGTSPFSLTNFFRPEHVISTWEPKHGLLQVGGPLRHEFAAMWAHLSPMLGTIPKPTLENITWLDDKADSEMTTMAALHVAKVLKGHYLVRIDKANISYAVSFGVNVSLVVSKLHPNFGMGFEMTKYCRVFRGVLPVYPPELRMLVQLAHGNHRWANKDIRFAWIISAAGCDVMDTRPCRTLGEDIRWTALSLCGSIYMPHGDISDLWTYLRETPSVSGVFGRIWDVLRRMELINAKEDNGKMWEMNPILRTLENQVLSANLGWRCYSVSAAALWVKAKQTDNAFLRRLFIRIGAIVAIGMSGVSVVDDLPEPALNDIWTAVEPFCLGGMRRGIIWILLGVYERNANNNAFRLTGWAHGGLSDDLDRSEQSRTPLITIHRVLALEGIFGLEPAKYAWISDGVSAISRKDMSALYDGIYRALVENLVALGPSGSASDVCSLLERSQPVKVCTGHLINPKLRTTVTLGVTLSVQYDLASSSLIAHGMTILPAEGLETILR